MYVKCVRYGVLIALVRMLEVLLYLSWIRTGGHFVVDLFLYRCLYDNSETTAHGSENTRSVPKVMRMVF